MAENPYISGQFYEGQYATAEPAHIYRDAVRDQRPAFLVEIFGSKETDAIAFKKSRGPGVVWRFIIRGSDGAWLQTDADDVYVSGGQTVWYLTKYDHPAYLVFTDENGAFRYVTYADETEGGIMATGTRPTTSSLAQGHYVGPYLDMLDDTGQKTWRVTVNSSNQIIKTHIKTEFERVDILRLSQGLRFAFRNGNLYKEAIIDVADIEMSLNELEWGYGGVATPRVGNIVIQLSTKEYEWLTQQRWDSRGITLWNGSTTAALTSWPIVLRGSTQTAEWDEDRMHVTLSDKAIFLERSIQTYTYEGTGNFEGGEDLKGRVKPLAYGRCLFVNPVLVDEVNNVYQVHGGPIDAILQVRDQGAFLVNAGNVENVYSWNPTSSDGGKYVTMLSHGFIRLAARPAGEVRVSLMGTTDTQRRNDLASILQAIARRRLPEITINTASFDAHRQRMSSSCNLYIDEERTVGDVFEELVSATGSILYISRANQLVLKHLEIDIPEAHLLDRDLTDDVPLHRVNPPKPGNVYKGGATRVYGPLENDQISPFVMESVRQVLTNEYRYNTIDFRNPNDPALEYRRHESAKTITINQPFDGLGEAAFWLSGIAHRQQAFRDVYEFSVKSGLFQYELGDTILLETTRFGMHVPRFGLVIYVNDRANEQITVLRMWC